MPRAVCCTIRLNIATLGNDHARNATLIKNEGRSFCLMDTKRVYQQQFFERTSNHNLFFSNKSAYRGNNVNKCARERPVDWRL